MSISPPTLPECSAEHWLIIIIITYHVQLGLGSQLLVLVGLVRRDLTLELVELPQLHILHEQVKLA